VRRIWTWWNDHEQVTELRVGLGGDGEASDPERRIDRATSRNLVKPLGEAIRIEGTRYARTVRFGLTDAIQDLAPIDGKVRRSIAISPFFCGGGGCFLTSKMCDSVNRP
jgi:hypothetical protein